MFPDLSCDDIFRLETKRLWLRWPRASDAVAITSFAALPAVAQMTAQIPHPYPPGEAERFVLRARADNAAGKGLILAVTQKGGTRPVIGLVSVLAGESQEIELGYVISPAYWGKGLATEAARAVIEASFSLTEAQRVLANSRVINPASRRVLEKCGFRHIGTGLDMLPARGGLHPCDRFALDRKNWRASLKARRMPAMTQQQTPPEPLASDASEAAAGELNSC
jgi:RimJ/RimL family protein N-acetyltransferase